MSSLNNNYTRVSLKFPLGNSYELTSRGRGEVKQDPATTNKRYLASLIDLFEQAARQNNAKVMRALSSLIDRRGGRG